MQFGILGPLEVRAGGRLVALGGAKPRAVLAVLVLHRNRPVSAERLALALWGEDVPPTAVKTIQVYVARLRKALDEESSRIISTRAGYCLQVGDGEFDAERFERGIAEGRRALAAGDGDQAASVVREALAMWRGPPLSEFASAPFAPPEIARLEEQRLSAIEVRVAADLAAGRHAELVGELQQLTASHPWREQLHAQLMLALYRSARQADALEAYRHARATLVEQLGVEPGTELRAMHEAVLAHDPSLAAPPKPDEQPPPLNARTLPAPPNRLVGRRRELLAIEERVRSSSTRLLTLTGPGGVGKTRLALEAARAVETDFADRAHFVGLAGVQDPGKVPATIVRALGIVVLEGESNAQAIERFLIAKHLLLIVDNVEHLLVAAPLFADLLRACPTLTVLATSREPLNLQAEERFPVAPFALPERTPSGDAVALFTERARARDPDFDLAAGNAAAVVEICRRVDGLPLAIELAAARCELLDPPEIAERLGAALDTPGAAARDAPARQRTLRATIGWSHALLSDVEQRCFARFAVFAGGATIEAAETIAAGELDTLDALVSKSLLTRRGHAPTRLGMLETIRAFAGERLAASADATSVRAAHFDFYLALCERHGTARALRGAGSASRLALLDAEIENLYAALDWAVATKDAGRSLALAAALDSYWLLRNRHVDALHWLEQVLALPGAETYPALRARTLRTKAHSLWRAGRLTEQSEVLIAAETIARQLRDPLLLSWVLQSRVHHQIDDSQLERADALADEALHWARTAGDDWEIAEASRAKAMAASNLAELRERVHTAEALLAPLDNLDGLASLRTSAAYAALCFDGGEHDAIGYAARAIEPTRQLDNPYAEMITDGNLGLAALLTGDLDTADRAFREELELCRAMVILPVAYEGLRGLAGIAVSRGADARAATLVGASDAHRFGWPEDHLQVRLDTTFFQPARARYGDDAWDADLRRGHALRFEDAVAYALQETPVVAASSSDLTETPGTRTTIGGAPGPLTGRC